MAARGGCSPISRSRSSEEHPVARAATTALQAMRVINDAMRCRGGVDARSTAEKVTPPRSHLASFDTRDPPPPGEGGTEFAAGTSNSRHLLLFTTITGLPFMTRTPDFIGDCSSPE